MTNIVVTNVRQIKDKGALKAVVEVKGELLGRPGSIRGIKIFETANNTWIQMPAEKFQNQEGKDCYNCWVNFEDRNIKDDVGYEIIAKYRVFIQNMPQEEPQGSFYSSPSTQMQYAPEEPNLPF